MSGSEDNQGKKRHSKRIENKGGPPNYNEGRGGSQQHGQSSGRGRGGPPGRGRSSGRGEGGGNEARERTPDPGVTYSAAMAGGRGGGGNPWPGGLGRGGPAQQDRPPPAIIQAEPRPRGTQSAGGGPPSSNSSSRPPSDAASEQSSGSRRGARVNSSAIGASGSISQAPGDRPPSNMNMRARGGQHSRSSSDSSGGGVQLLSRTPSPFRDENRAGNPPGGRVAPPNTPRQGSGRSNQRVGDTPQNPINADSDSDVEFLSSQQVQRARSPGTPPVVIPPALRQGRGGRRQNQPSRFDPNDPFNQQGRRRGGSSGGGAAGGMQST